MAARTTYSAPSPLFRIFSILTVACRNESIVCGRSPRGQRHRSHGREPASNGRSAVQLLIRSIVPHYPLHVVARLPITDAFDEFIRIEVGETALPFFDGRLAAVVRRDGLEHVAVEAAEQPGEVAH